MLFVASGNKFSGVSNIVKAQVDSLRREGVEIEIFSIDGKGWTNYLKSIFKLRFFLKRNAFQIVHSHYSFSTWVAILAGSKNVVSSLMGSDVNASKILRFFIKWSIIPFCKLVIVKSESMKVRLRSQKVSVLPNGVDLDKFYPLCSASSKSFLNWEPNKIHILFPSDPSRREKNFELLSKSIEAIGRDDLELHFLDRVPHSEVNLILNASDIVCLTSKWEGSPNAIKEAMACNKIILSTKVGDVPNLLEAEKGAFLTDDNVLDCKNQLICALDYYENISSSTSFRKKIIALELSSEQIAAKLVNLYRDILLSKLEHSKK